MRVTRADYVDEYVEDGESAVLVGQRVVVLSELATAITRLVAGEGRDLDDLATRLRESFGDPPDGGDLLGHTESAVRLLCEQGILKVRRD